ncbi:MAG: CPBP family intramembrane metalloprotease [Clostridiales bacterium]|nr:CPBP family intramembrane metalloprotease [Clostridiales bacterium]
MPLWLKRDYRAVSYTLASCVLGVIFMRLFVYFVALPSDTYGQSLAANALFALPTQLLFFLAIPFCIYKFLGERTVRQTLEYSSCGKFKPFYLFALPLGFVVFVLTLGVSSAWTALLKQTGYTVNSSTPDMPSNFVFGFFIAEVMMTAILPAVCEEFCMRGGLLSTAQNTFKTIGCVLLCGVAFGLFHQNIRQVFYTSLFGALAAYLTIKTKSLYPAMLTHFGNNFCSVFFDYASNYNWAFGGGFYAFINSTSVWALVLVFLAAGVIGVALVVAMLYFREKRVIRNKLEVLKDAAFDATNKRVIIMGEFDPERVSELEMEKEVYGRDYERERFKPSARDIMIIVALGVVTLCTTVFTYVWGFFY